MLKFALFCVLSYYFEKKRVVRQVVEMYVCENQCNIFEECAGHSKSGRGESDRGGFLQDPGSLVDDAVGKTVEVD